MKFALSVMLLASVTTLRAEVSPTHVEKMLQQMVRENVISAKEAQKASIRMKSMKPEQWLAINKQAATIAARSPASVSPSQNNIEEVHGIDLDGAQFKAIENEMKKIIPQYQD